MSLLFPLPMMIAFYAGGTTSGAGDDDAPSIWTMSLDGPATKELHRYALVVPPRCWLAKPCKIDKDGYTMLGPGATMEERRNHRGDRCNIYGRTRFGMANPTPTRHRPDSAASAASNPSTRAAMAPSWRC
ncbi:hypothetical protein ZWY2020_054001 [Hordeum vulgare]|nr:hypothetical protein ZWY2020_054001 [Hordeum vulgare]